MSDELTNTDSESYYSLVPEAGMMLVGDDIINLRKVALIRKQGDKTLVYYGGVSEPVALPGRAFDEIRDAVFAIDDLDDDEEDFDEE
ncbi:MAG: hypothetical protein LUE17_17815 [Planctomycetaceae bacterium]|nr:hypothetical protein [Planctomycetaceae bacterium]